VILMRTDDPFKALRDLIVSGFRLERICGWTGTPDRYTECRYVDKTEAEAAVRELLELYDGVTAELNSGRAAAEVDFYRDVGVPVEAAVFAEPARGAVEIRC